MSEEPPLHRVTTGTASTDHQRGAQCRSNSLQPPSTPALPRRYLPPQSRSSPGGLIKLKAFFCFFCDLAQLTFLHYHTSVETHKLCVVNVGNIYFTCTFVLYGCVQKREMHVSSNRLCPIVSRCRHICGLQAPIVHIC